MKMILWTDCANYLKFSLVINGAYLSALMIDICPKSVIIEMVGFILQEDDL